MLFEEVGPKQRAWSGLQPAWSLLESLSPSARVALSLATEDSETQVTTFKIMVANEPYSYYCRYCHSFVESSSEANIPSTSVCMNCHQNIRKESKDLTFLKDSYENNNPIEWVKVHMLPDYAYFDHSVHLNAGVGCVSCHGRIDQMEVVQQSEPLSMSWCLDCHRSPDDHIRPNTPVTTMDWDKPENHDDIVKKFKIKNNIKPPQDCSACHR